MKQPSTLTVRPDALPPDLRRRRLLWALPGGLAAASPLALIACGGSGDSAASGSTAQAALRLPAGVDASALTIVSNGAEARASGSSAAVAMLDANLALVSVVHDNDKLVLLGLLAAGAADQALDARSSAAALMFMAMGGWALTPPDRSRLHQLILADAQLAALTAVVEARLAADPFALDGPDESIASALKASMRGASASARLRRERATAAGRARALAAGDVTPLLRIEPGGEVNGISVDQSGEEPGFAIQNTKRRRGIAHAYKVAYKPSDQPKVDLALAAAQYERIEIGSTQSLTVFSALSDIVSGTAPWSPVTTPRYGLPMQEGVEQTFYEVVYITPVHGRPEPPFFQEVRYSLLRDVWREELAQMFEEAQMDLVFGAILEALGFGGIARSTASFNEAIAALSAAPSGDVAVLLRAARAGDAMLPGLIAWLRSVSEGNALLSPAYRAGVAALVRQADAQVATELAAGQMSRARLLAFHGVIRVMLAVSVVAGVLDTCAQYRDLHEGESGSLFTATLVAPKVLVSPSSGKVGRGSEQRLTARVTGAAPGAPLRFKWALSGSDLANLSDGRGAVGAAFETDSEAVTLATTPSTQGTLTITVQALLVDGGSTRSLGTATSKLEMDDTSVRLSPTSALVERVGGSQVFTLSITPTPAAGTAVSYEWSCPSQYGSLSSGGQSTSAGQGSIVGTEASATYAVRSGLTGGESETLRCVAFRTENGVRIDIGTASADVTVKQKFNIEFVALPPQTPTDNTLGATARLVEALPSGATVAWTWTHSGVGSLQAPGNDADKPNSVASFSSGPNEGTALFSVQARVVTADGQATLVLPVTRSTEVKKGLREITFEASGGVFACTDTRACGVSEYTAFIVPRYSKAVSYRAVFSEFGYGPCNRSVTWTAPVGDGGGCRFPITYHPHPGPSDAWAVWIGFGGPLTGPGKCTVTVTLAP